MKAKENDKYDFGEKEIENINGQKIPVEYYTPKYKEAKNKAVELLESAKFKGILKASDFWILVNTYANKTKAMYSGLIISHDGCLKVNDVLEEKLKFKPECVTIDKDGFNNSLVFAYNCPEQGIYEVGEVSKSNCKNDYPYAMALKRCMDRVILKNSKIAYSGIYSDSESDEFLKRTEDEGVKETAKKIENKTTETDKKIEEKTTETDIKITPAQIKEIVKFYKADNLEKLLLANGLEKLQDMSMEAASEVIKRIKQKLEEKKNGTN